MAVHGFRTLAKMKINNILFKARNFSVIVIIVFLIKISLISPSNCQESEQKIDQIKDDLNPIQNYTNSNSSSETPKSSPPPPPPYAISSIYLTQLAETEQLVYEELKQYVMEAKERLELVETYLKDYEQTTGKRTMNIKDPAAKAEEAATNPLLAYRMISRFVNEFNAAENDLVLKLDLETALLKRLDELSNSIQEFPNAEGLQEATGAILLVQHFYNLTSNDLRRGFISGKDAGVGLTPDQCYEITEHAVSKEFYYLAFEWLDTMDSIINEADPANVPLDLPETLADLRDWLVRRHDDNFEANKAKMNKYMFDEKLAKNPNGRKMKDVTIEKFRGQRDHLIIGAYEMTFIDLCNGRDHRTEDEKSKLYCWLERKSHPLFSIWPLKIELLSAEPYLVRIYDVVTENWIKTMKTASLPDLFRVRQKSLTLLRSALFAWLRDEEIPSTPLAQRVETIFNVRAVGEKAADLLQIATYGFGGNIGIHHDYMGDTPFSPRSPDSSLNNPTLTTIGERMSTFLLYLNDVQEGGYTAFPIVGTYVEPIKGSAIFWYTALRNGKVDVKTLHGACPVLWGHKWIATKWSHQFENFRKRPCAIDPDL